MSKWCRGGLLEQTTTFQMETSGGLKGSWRAGETTQANVKGPALFYTWIKKCNTGRGGAGIPKSQVQQNTNQRRIKGMGWKNRRKHETVFLLILRTLFFFFNFTEGRQSQSEMKSGFRCPAWWSWEKIAIRCDWLGKANTHWKSFFSNVILCFSGLGELDHLTKIALDCVSILLWNRCKGSSLWEQ